MGDCQKCDLRVDFDRTVRLTFVGSKVTSDAGLLAYRERDEALGLTVTAGKRLEDSRTGRNTRHALLPLIRQSIYSRLAGYEDVNDAERLCVDQAYGTLWVAAQANRRRWPRSAVAYNLGNFLRRLALPQSVRQWSLTTLKEKLVKIGAKVTRHAKYVTFQMAEVAVPRQLFASILKRIGRLKNSPALCPSGEPRSPRRDGGAGRWRTRGSGFAPMTKRMEFHARNGPNAPSNRPPPG